MLVLESRKLVHTGMSLVPYHGHTSTCCNLNVPAHVHVQVELCGFRLLINKDVVTTGPGWMQKRSWIEAIWPNWCYTRLTPTHPDKDSMWTPLPDFAVPDYLDQLPWPPLERS